MPTEIQAGKAVGARFGVAFRLGAGIALITLGTVVAGITALLLLTQFRDGFAGIASAKLPAVAIISQITQQTERIVAESAAISSADEASREQGLRNIAGQRLILQAMADQLQEDRGNLPVLDGFNEHLTALIDNVRKLGRIIDAKTKLDTVMAQSRRRLLELDETLPWAGGRPDPAWQELAWLSEQAQRGLALGLAAETATELEFRRDGFARALEGMRSRLSAMPPSAQRDAFLRHMDSVEDLGRGPANVFDGRAEQISLHRSEREVLTQSRELSSEFSASVADAIQTDSVALTDTVRRGMDFLMVVVVVCIGAALGVFLYVNRAIIGRLVGLKEVMYDHVAGTRAAIPTSGNDEITAMARALQFFVTTIEGREAALRAAKETAESKSEQVATLLDNSGEGFLSFDRDLVVDSEYSRACEAMFGRSPAGLPVTDLLCPDNDNSCGLFRMIVPQVLSPDCDPWKREVMLSLLPREFVCGDKLLSGRFTVLDNGHLMAVVSDVTKARELEAKVESEHRQLEMIVAAVTERGDFFDTVSAFRAFAETDVPAVLASHLPPRLMVREIYRQVHTFKGLLNQFSFQRTPGKLHDLETRLNILLGRGDRLTVADVAETVGSVRFCELIEADLAIIRDALGQAFVENAGHIALSPAQAARLETFAGCLMRGEPIDASAPDVRALLADLVRLRKVPVKAMLEGYDRVVRQTASKLEKEVAPVEVEGGENIWIDPEAYRPFLRALVHVFRNAVVHGIEDPDTRLSFGKRETGTIRCTVATDDRSIVLGISDDGAGIDLAALRAKLRESGQDEASLDDVAVLDLIFADNLTTIDGANDLAGRGVGLSAVRSVTREMGGRAEVRTSPGEGTVFVFSLPLYDGAVALAS